MPQTQSGAPAMATTPADDDREGRRERYFQEEYNRLRIEFQNYDQLVELVCCIELWLEHNYGPEGAHGQRLVYFDRYPPCVSGQGDYGPDFTAFFEDGYGIVGEVKSQVRPSGQGLEQLLRQIETYATVAFLFRAADEPQPSVCPDRKDILLLVPMENAVQAIEFIDDARTGDNEFDLCGFPVILGHYPNERTGPDEYYWWKFRWDDIPGNSPFRDGNVMGPPGAGEDGDLNHQFGGQGPLTMHVDRNDHADRKADACFSSDEPPAIYALANKVWPYITLDFVADLEGADNNRWHHERRIDAPLSVSAMTDALVDRMPAGAVRGSWIRNALDLLCEIDWAKRINGDRYRVTLRRPRYMRQAQDYFMKRIATARAKKRSHEEQREQDEETTPRLPLRFNTQSRP